MGSRSRPLATSWSINRPLAPRESMWEVSFTLKMAFTEMGLLRWSLTTDRSLPPGMFAWVKPPLDPRQLSTQGFGLEIQWTENADQVTSLRTRTAEESST